MGPWPVDIETFEEVTGNESSRRLVLQLAQLSREGRLASVASELIHDPELDEPTRLALADLAADEAFLLAAEDYLSRTSVLH